MKNKWLTFAIVIITLYLLSFGIANINKLKEKDQIAIIPIKGPISMEGASNGILGGGSIGSNDLISYIKNANKNNNVKAIILEINSPGGTVLASKEVAKAVKESPKPVVSVIREVGASGAYWIASASDYIIADELSITGSIGVTGSYLEFSELLDNYGITYEELKAGEYKEAGNPLRPLEPKERELIQKEIDTIYQIFIQTVAENRNLSIQKTTELAEGKIYLGIDAKQNGLIDDFGNLETGIKKAENLANITNANIIRYEHKQTFLDALTGVSTQGAYYFGRGFAKELSTISPSQNYNIRAE